MLNNHTLHSASGLKLKPWKFKVDRPINGNGGGVGGRWKLMSRGGDTPL